MYSLLKTAFTNVFIDCYLLYMALRDATFRNIFTSHAQKELSTTCTTSGLKSAVIIVFSDHDFL